MSQRGKDELVRHFGARADTTRRALRALTGALQRADPAGSSRALSAWQRGFPAPTTSNRTGEQSGTAQELFSIHTYYALVVKLVACFAARRSAGGGPSRFIPTGRGDALRAGFADLERGAVFRECGVENFVDVEGDCFGWYTSAWSAELAEILSEISGHVDACADGGLFGASGEARDFLKNLYEDLVPRPVRHQLGEYYTPDWLAERLLVQTMGEADLGDPETRVLDPACGSGTFLVAVINHVRRRAAKDSSDERATLSALLRNVVGFDINPLATLAARTNYLLALGGLLDDRTGIIEIPVYRKDSLVESTSELRDGLYDYVIGNPPWVNWEHLPDHYRKATESLWRKYGLFPKRRTGFATILGSAKYDVSALMTYVSVDRYLRPSGRLGFVLPQNVFKSAGAGQGFRRFRLPDGTTFAPLSVEDMTEIKPFKGVNNRTTAAVFVKGQQVRYPVSYYRMSFCRRERRRADNECQRIEQSAEPIDPSDPTSAWRTAYPECLAALRKLAGKSGYVGRKGVTASLNGVFWLRVHGEGRDDGVIVSNATERSKKSLESIRTVIEDRLVYPLVRGRDVTRWAARSELSFLLTHKAGMRLRALPEEEMRREHPKTWKYLTRFESQLRQSGILRRYFKPTDPFYSIFNVGDYTFAANKVVVREIASSLTAAVVGLNGERPSIPDHKLVLVDCANPDEAHYLCAVLNSRPARTFVESYTLNTQFSTHIFDQLAIPKFLGAPLQSELARRSAAAHLAVATGDASTVHALEAEVDDLAAQMWSLSAVELEGIRRQANMTRKRPPDGASGQRGVDREPSHG